MKNFYTKVVSLTLALLLCLLPIAAQAESPIQARMAQVYEGMYPIEATITLELEEGLRELAPSPEVFEALQKMLRTTELKVFVLKGGLTELPQLGFSLSIQGLKIADASAWLGERGLYVITSLLPGKALLYDDQEFTQILGEQMEQLTAQAENYQAIAASMEKYAAIAYQWMTGTPGLVTLSEDAVPATEKRDSAVASVAFRVTPDQLKSLLVTLAEEFAKDEVLQQLLALSIKTDSAAAEDFGAQLLAAAKALPTTGQDMTGQIFAGSDDGLVGIDGMIPAMFGSGDSVASITYDRQTANDGKTTKHSFIGGLAGENGGISAIKLEIESDLAAPQAPKEAFLLWLHQQDSADHGQIDFKISHNAESVLAADREQLASQTGISLEFKPGKEGLMSQNDMTDLFSPRDEDISAQVDFSSDARLVGEKDFVCESTTGFTVMGQKLGKVHVRITSETDFFISTSDLEMVEVSKLDLEGTEALDTELEEGFNAAVVNVVSVLPPELLQMMQEN